MAADGLNRLIKLHANLEKLSKEKAAAFRDRMGARLAGEIISHAQKRTPVDTGKLRRSYSARRDGVGAYTVYNDTEYAEYIEYGHRTGVRRHSSGLLISDPREIGWQPGHYMLSRGASEVARDAPAHIEKELGNLLRRELFVGL